MTEEPIIDPTIPICDAHHHLWHVPEGLGGMFEHLPRKRFLIEEFMAEIALGHNIVSSVFMQCFTFYRMGAAPEWQSLGETEFVNGQAAMAASGRYGSARACAGIVSCVDLHSPNVSKILAAHVGAGGDRLRGIRQVTAVDPLDIVPNYLGVEPGFMASADFRKGFERLEDFELSFDAYVLHPQLGELEDLARAFPSQTIILNHLGGPIRIGIYAEDLNRVFQTWRQSIQELSECPNVVIKLGGLGMGACGFGFDKRETPPSSEEVADAWRPYVLAAIDAFGVSRCMFESNFPADSISCDYPTIWNAFKRISADYRPEERNAVFRHTAERVYRLQTTTAT
jgi:L-fuconolactonase